LLRALPIRNLERRVGIPPGDAHDIHEGFEIEAGEGRAEAAARLSRTSGLSSPMRFARGRHRAPREGNGVVEGEGSDVLGRRPYGDARLRGLIADRARGPRLRVDRCSTADGPAEKPGEPKGAKPWHQRPA
jgi:hypothetical protein